MDKKTILIIDDDPDIVKYLKKLFSNNGYDTIVAYDGVEADAIVKDVMPDLVTLDLEMPKEWGPRFYRKFTKNKAARDVPVIVISGVASGDHAIRNAVKFIAKPFDPNEVLAAVKEAIG